jgi:hypothetical protein
MAQSVERHYRASSPSPAPALPSRPPLDPADPRSRVITNSSELDKQLDAKRRVQNVKKRVVERKAKIVEVGGDDKASLEAEKGLNPTGSGE